MPLYSDLSTSYKAPLVYDLESVKQSLHNILATSKSERVFNPEFGANLEDLLHEPLDVDIANEIYTRIFSSIEKYDDRLIILNDQSYIEPDYDNNTYDIKLVFMVKGLADTTFEFTGVLSE